MNMLFRVIVVLVMMLPAGVMAQESKGIQFDRSMSWNELVEKATRENKYIFMDVMATWCGPCKSMAEAVFPNEEVGKFFNERFICVKLQIDKTKQDDDYVKAWYKEVDVIRKKFNIYSVPTLLFFDPQGEAVHIMPGATSDAKAFIDLGKDALNEEKQLYGRWRKYEAGERDVEFLYDLSVDLAMYKEKSKAMCVANTFWQTITPEERLLDKGIRYASEFISSTKDETFRFFLEHAEEADAVLGAGSAMKKVLTLIDREMVLPFMKDSVNVPDWQAIHKDLCAKYPRLKDEFPMVVADRKVYYAQRYHKDELYLEALLEIVPIYGEKGNTMLARSYAHNLGTSARNQEQRDIALDWLKKLQDGKDAVGMAYYAEVLFLSGKKEEGKRCVDLAMKAMGEGTIVYTEVKRIKEQYAE